jgi:hypothetical protein
MKRKFILFMTMAALASGVVHAGGKGEEDLSDDLAGESVLNPIRDFLGGICTKNSKGGSGDWVKSIHSNDVIEWRCVNSAGKMTNEGLPPGVKGAPAVFIIPVTAKQRTDGSHVYLFSVGIGDYVSVITLVTKKDGDISNMLDESISNTKIKEQAK